MDNTLEIAKLEKTINDLKAHIDKTQQDLSNLTDERDKVTQEIRLLEATKISREADIKQLVNNRDNIKAELDETSSILTDKKTVLENEYNAKKAELVAEVSASREELDKLMSSINYQRSVLDKMENDKALLEGSIVNLTQTKEGFVKMIEDLSVQYNAKTKDIETLDKKLDDFNTENSILFADIDSKKAEINSLSDNISKLKAEEFKLQQSMQAIIDRETILKEREDRVSKVELEKGIY